MDRKINQIKGHSYTAIDDFKGSNYMLFISRGGPSLLCKLMLSRDESTLTLHVDDIQGWNPI